MNTNAATQAHQKPSPESASRWSTADDLLVWTVSRIDGGRRHGVERDCHVVYGLSRGYFVEQTRKFRASAEQCIEMLQQGKRAGTTQRKIALDSIVAIRSDARTGRLQIRTINGTHQLDPVSYDEADVLRQIAIELELRMPPGGAEYSRLDGSQGAAFGGDEAAEERRALVSLENARAEDIPDTQQEPEYQYQPADGTDHRHEPLELHGDDDPGHFTEEELNRLSATLSVETDPVDSDVTEPADQELPGDITVAGGVEITYEPATVSEPAPAAIAQTDPSVQESSPGIAASSKDAALWVAPEAADDSPIYMSQHAAPAEAVEPTAIASGEDPTGPAPTHTLPSEINDRFGRLHSRALRQQSESATPLPEPVAEPDYEPINPNPSPAPSSVFAAPATPPAEAVADGTATDPSQQGLTTPRPEGFTPSDDRRENDDPSFPSIFDRRGAGPAPRSQHPAQFGDDLPVDHSVSHHVPPLTVGSVQEEERDESDSDLPDAPPTISAPAGPPVAGTGGSVGFNPDFDVNPFR